MTVCIVVFILFSVFLTGIESEQCYTKFRMKPTCVITYGISMPDILQRSKTACALSCVNTPTCQSFFYIHGTRICRQNSEKLTNFTDACSDLQMYVEKVCMPNLVTSLFEEWFHTYILTFKLCMRTFFLETYRSIEIKKFFKRYSTRRYNYAV